MNTIPPILRQQQSAVLSLVAILVIAFVCLQLWLLVTTMETAFLQEPASALPALIMSASCTLASWWLWRLF